MSIKLDWEVESEGGWAEIGEDAAALAARKRQAKRIRTIIGILLGAGVLVGGVIGFRLYTADQQARSDLRATVTAETAAIRIGDNSAYLDIQQNIGSWREMQSERFSQYQADSSHVKTDGEIETLDMVGGKGRVVVKETVDDRSYNVVWFYQHDNSGWKHVPPEVEYWGWPHDFTSPHYSISYWDEDADFVRKLQDRLEAWWDRACRLTECHQGAVTAPGLLKIRVEPDPLLQIGWAAYDPHTLRVPSPLLGRVPSDGSIDPQLERALAGFVAQYWEKQLLGDAPDDNSDLAWAHDEFRQWLGSAFVPGLPPAPLLTPLAETSGAPAVLTLIDRVKQNQDVVAALRDATGKDVSDLHVLWDRYLTYRLRAEAAMVAGSHAQEALLLYRDPERNGDASTLDVWIGLLNAMPDTITVASTRQVGDLLWAEVHFKRTQAAGENGTPTVATSMTNEPFRLANGRWVHTTATPEEYGSLMVQRGEHMVLHYQSIDAPTVDGLLPVLEQRYGAIVSDIGVTSPPALDFQVSPTISGPGFALSPPSGYPEESPDGIAVWIGSPYSAIYPDEQPLQATLLSILTRDMVVQLVGFQVRPLNESNSLAVAIARWEVARLGLDTTGMSGQAVRPGATPPDTLDALWSQAQDLSTGGEKAVAADALVSLVVEKQGPGAVPALLQNLSAATSMEDWLSRSVGLHAADIEAEWKLRLRALLPNPLQLP